MAKVSGIITGVGSKIDNASGACTKSGYVVGGGPRLTAFQTACDVVGMTEIPIVSQGADLISGGISLATGDYVGAALSVGSLIPGIGQATGAIKMARRGKKLVDAASNIKESEKFLELTQKGRNIETATSGAKHIETPKFLETTNKGKKIDKTNTKLNETKKSDKSVIDAKTPQKERIKEKENMTNNNIPNQESSVGNKLDINEATYYFNGNAISKDMQMKNYNNNSSFSKNENYYNQWVENTEKSKTHYNPTNVTPKQYPFKPFGI